MKYLTKTLLTSCKLYITLFIIFVGVIFFDICINIIVKKFIEEQNDILLLNYRNSVEKSIGHDIYLIDTSEKQFFILQDVKTDNTKKNLHLIRPIGNSKFLYQQKKENYIFIDLKALQEYLDELLPDFIKYRITFNRTILNKIKLKNKILKNYEIGKALKIALTLEDESIYMLKNYEKIFNIRLYSIIISTGFFLIIVVIFLKQKSNYNKIILRQFINLKKVRNRILVIKNAQKAEKTINSMFVKKTTEIYVREELAKVENDNKLKKNILKTIGNKNYIFPIVLKGNEIKSRIKISEFFFNLEKVFCLYQPKLNIKMFTEYLTIRREEEILYQIVFSLTANIMMFLENQSDEIKSINIKVFENKITFEYNGYPMYKETIIRISQYMKNHKYSDIFLLTGIKLFDSIEYNKFIYSISTSGFNNIIQLDFYSETKVNQDNKAKIINFEEVKKKIK